MVAAGSLFAHAVPPCAGPQLLSFDAGYRGSPRRERFFASHEWAVELLRRLHAGVVAEATALEEEAELFYVPAFFGLLLALHDAASLECLTTALAALAAHSAFRRNAGYDHFYLHGLEQPVLATFDYAEGRGRAAGQAAGPLFEAFYATLQNSAVLATGDLAQGSLAAALGGALYGMRRVINVPFVFEEDCRGEGPVRPVRLAFVGSVQPYNRERLLFYKALEAEFGQQLRRYPSGRAVLDHPLVQLRALVRLGPDDPPLNTTERSAFGGRRGWLRRLYRRTELCVVAPGDAPVLGKRLSDALATGCLPAVLVGPGSYPVLPLQSSVRWEDFAVTVRLGDDAAGARWALRKLLRLGGGELARRRAALLRWRPRLALGRGPGCRGRDLGPGAAELALAELRALGAIWRRQLPPGGLALNASSRACAATPLSARCGALASLLPDWGPAPALA